MASSADATSQSVAVAGQMGASQDFGMRSLEDLRDRIAAGMAHDHPVPFYHVVHRRSVRDIL